MGQTAVPGLLGVPARVRDRAPIGNPIVLLGEFNTYVGNETGTWGVNRRKGLHDPQFNFVVISSNLLVYVLDAWVNKRR